MIISSLPFRVREQLDGKLRAAAFGGLAEIGRWLADTGHPVDAPSLAAHSAALQAADRLSQRAYGLLKVTLASEAAGEPAEHRQRVNDIVIELGRIEVYKRALLDELVALQLSGHTVEPPNVPTEA